MSIIQGIPDEQVQRAVRRIVYGSADNEERELHFTQMLRDIDVNNGFNKTSAWQTLEEFKANPVDGWCWIDTESMSMRMAFYSDGVFNTTDEMSGYYVTDAITHVMPVPRPEAPK